MHPTYFFQHLADTMMKFACFETIVEMVYKHAVPKPKDQCSKPLQLAVSFAGGYIAGVFCAAISHPADNLVSFLNNAKGATVADVSCKSYAKEINKNIINMLNYIAYTCLTVRWYSTIVLVILSNCSNQ